MIRVVKRLLLPLCEALHSASWMPQEEMQGFPVGKGVVPAHGLHPLLLPLEGEGELLLVPLQEEESKLASGCSEFAHFLWKKAMRCQLWPGLWSAEQLVVPSLCVPWVLKGSWEERAQKERQGGSYWQGKEADWLRDRSEAGHLRTISGGLWEGRNMAVRRKRRIFSLQERSKLDNQVIGITLESRDGCLSICHLHVQLSFT